MNASLPEEAGLTARSLIEGLKGQPAVLALSIANAGLLIFMFFALRGAASSRELIIQRVLDNSNQIHTILQQRSVSCPDPGNFKLQSAEPPPP